MQRRKLLFFGPVAPLSFFLSHYLKALAPRPRKPADPRRQAAQLNDFATSIKSPGDAKLLVDLVAEIFAEDLLPAWATTKVRESIALAEFAAVSGRRELIPERRLSQAWNGFLQTVGAPPEARVNEAEVHNLRDAFFSVASYYWRRGSQTIWTAPGIYAVNDQGEIAEGCRAVEAIRILWDLANMPANLAAARNRVRQGILASDQFRKVQEVTEPLRGSVSFSIAEPNPIEVATQKFVKENGIRTFSKAVSTMVDQIFVA